MSADRAKRLAQLRQAYESGFLDEDTYQAAIMALQTEAVVQAEVEGSGPIAQQGGAAATAGGIAVGHDVQGGIHVANELPPQVLALFARQFGFDPTASDAAALKTYFDHVVLERHSKLSFLFIRPETGKVYTEADIETVFVPLRMTDPEALKRQARLARRLERFDRLPREMEEGVRPITLPEVLKKYPCFLMRGKPGCGKTTLLRHIALSFARGEHQEKLGWDEPAPLPILVSLRNFGAFLKRRADCYIEPQPRALLEYLEDHLRGAGVRFSPDFLTRRLDAGQCFLLLDALDEASGTLGDGSDLRAAVARQISSFIRHYAPRGVRFALTSRPRAFQDEGAMRRALPQPQVCDVFDLDPDGYRQLITNLLLVLTGDPVAGQAEADDLFDRIALNPHLADLAGNPLLCTTLVLVYKYRGRKLPERRVDVLHEIVTLLLGRWEEERRDVVSPEELARLGTTAPTTEQAIQFRRRASVALAWQMQGDNVPEVPAEVAVQALARFYCEEERASQAAAEKWARLFLGVAHERSGLFIAVDEGVHAFAHQAFREYLAATHLVNAGEAHLIEEVLRHAPTPDEWWEQVLLLAGAHPELSSGATGRLVQVLLEKEGLDHAHLAARCAQDMTDKLPGAQRKRLQDWLMAIIKDHTRPLRERALAGDALALAGDPRPGVGLRPDGLPDIPGCLVPAGPFWMGSPDDDEMAMDREKPLHQGDIDYPYWIARYPITNAQFDAFVRDGGYTETWRRCWTQAGWEWKGDRIRPETYGGAYDLPNHPVVGVSWYEAAAFTRWLTERWGEDGVLPDGWQARLPSEREWEKASRGGLEIPVEPLVSHNWLEPVTPRVQPNAKPQRRYPWGDDADPNRANYDDTRIGHTSAVGCFPGGASPYGALDMSGNVDEWCHSLDRSYPYHPKDGREDPEAKGLRVLRGGAFVDIQRDFRCALRDWYYPYLRFNYVGFRLVVAPGYASER